MLIAYQLLTGYIDVPTNILIAIVFICQGALLMLAVVALVVYMRLGVTLRRHRPFAFAAMLGLVGYVLASDGVVDTLKTLSYEAANGRDITDSLHGHSTIFRPMEWTIIKLSLGPTILLDGNVHFSPASSRCCFQP